MVLVIGADGRVVDGPMPLGATTKVLALHQGRIREVLVDTSGGGEQRPTLVIAETPRHSDVARLAPTLPEVTRRGETVRTSPTLVDADRRADAPRIPSASLTASEAQAIADRLALAVLRLAETPSHRDAATFRVLLTSPQTLAFKAPVAAVQVEGWAAGGGGGAAGVGGGGGGGGGAYARATLALVPGQTYQLVIPAGAALGTGGADFTFGDNLVVAKGGGPGGAAAGTSQGAAGAAGSAAASTGTTKFSGGAGGGGNGLNVAGGGGGGGAGDSANGGAGLADGTSGTGGVQGGGVGSSGTSGANPGAGRQAGGGGAGGSGLNPATAGGPGQARVTFTV